jgi:hypothetical protein
MPLGTLLSSFHTLQQESGCWAGTGNSLWKSLQWHFLKSTRKSSSSEGSSALYPENSIAWSQCRPGLRLTGDETKQQHKDPKVVSLYKTVMEGPMEQDRTAWMMVMVLNTADQELTF